MKAELDLFNYATKSDVRKETGVDTSNFTKKVNLTSLKSDVDKVDIYKLKTVPTDWSKLNNVADDDVAKNTVYDELVRNWPRLKNWRSWKKISNHNKCVTNINFIKFT